LALSPHEPPLQYWPAAQSASLAQVDRQALRPQVNGKQEVEAGTLHEPAPSHEPPAVKVVPGMGQDALVQAVPWTYFRQEPAWHLPSVPQEVGP
jgi:hypothetical protein